MKLLRCLIPEHRRGLLLTAVLGSLILATVASQAASDTDVTILKAETVLIESNRVTIIAEAKVSLTLTSGDYKADYKGNTWMGRPASHITIKADKATLTITRQQRAKPDGLSDAAAANFKAAQETDDKGWEMTVEAAKDLQEGKEVGRIGYYAPEIVIKNNLIQSINGLGYFYRKK